jgi:tryptophan synthase alpha chain
MVSKVAPTLSAPLVLFTYYNPIIRRGMDKFCQQIKEAGAAGRIQDGCRDTAQLE